MLPLPLALPLAEGATFDGDPEPLALRVPLAESRPLVLPETLAVALALELAAPEDDTKAVTDALCDADHDADVLSDIVAVGISGIILADAVYGAEEDTAGDCDVLGHPEMDAVANELADADELAKPLGLIIGVPEGESDEEAEDVCVGDTLASAVSDALA